MMIFRHCSVHVALGFISDQGFYSCILFTSNKSYVPATRNRETVEDYATPNLFQHSQPKSPANVFFVACDNYSVRIMNTVQ